MKGSNKDSEYVDEFIQCIRSAIGQKTAALHEPIFDGNEWEYVKDCIDSGSVASVGKYVEQFEGELVRYTKANFVISVSSGTSALHIALKLSGVLPGEEVLLPSLTFVATANAVRYCDAIPHFVDSEERTLGIDGEKLREYLKINTQNVKGKCVNKLTGNTIRALIIMHTFGHPSDLDTLLLIAEEFNLIVIEDAAESIGSLFKGQHVGTFGTLGVLSFNGNKTITSGGGGAILTNDEALALRGRHLSTTAKKPHKWNFEHDEIGFNYRMPNINAALGLAQLEKIEHKIRRKRDLFRKYYLAFERINDVEIFQEPVNCRSNYWLQTAILKKGNETFRNYILEKTNEINLVTRPAWTKINELEPYRIFPRMDLSCAKSLHERIINLPSSPQLLSDAK